MKIWIPLIISSLIISFLVFTTVFILNRVWKNGSQTRNMFKNASLLLFSSLCFLIIIEVVFGVFVVQSDGFGFTLASRRWFQEYWNPINSNGYRDYEHNWKQNILFVVGDSFIAGHGIKKIDDRLAGVIAKKLGNDWSVAVLAQNGWATPAEYNALVKHQKQPTQIIFSYYINDIESAARANGLNRPRLIRLPNSWISPFVNNSFVLNWFYWRIYRGGLGDIYWKYLKHAYSDPGIWSSHKQTLGDIISFARQMNSGIAFIVWPNLNHIEGSLEFTSRVVEFLEEQDVKVVDLSTHFRGRSAETLVVNALDGHPNEKTNTEVAKLVYKLLFQQK